MMSFFEWFGLENPSSLGFSFDAGFTRSRLKSLALLSQRFQGFTALMFITTLQEMTSFMA